MAGRNTYKLVISSEYKDGSSVGLAGLAKQMAGMGQSVERGKRREVLSHQRAAREVERIGAQTTRQAEQQARFRERIVTQSASRSATAQIREQRRASNEMIRLIDKVKRADDRPGRRTGGRGYGINGGRIAGVATGVAGGAYLAKGYRDSTSKEDALAGLQGVVTKVGPGGVVDKRVLGEQMGRFTELGTALGNKLPGTTTEYLDQFSVLKQRGLEVEDILSGAGKSAAYLSASNRADPGETARDVATYGQIYGLKGREYEKSTDLLSRIKTAKDLDAGELIEASKYFQGRAGTPLGLKGLEGADQSTRYLAFMRQKTGLEGSAVGTASGTFLTNLIKKPKEVAKLSRAAGVDLSPVDKKGRFIGLEALVEKFAKLDGKLTNKQQVEFGSKIAGEEGSAIFSAMVSKGAEYKTFNEQINSVLGMMEKADIMTGTTSAKMEALAGTYTNLNAELFGNLTKSLDPLIDKTNTYIGQLQGIAAQHQNVAAFGAGVVGIGSASLGAISGVTGLIDKLGILGGGGGSGGGGIAGTGMDVSDIVTGTWAGGRVLKGAGRAVVGSGLGLLGGPVGITAALGFGAYKLNRSDARATQKENQEATSRLEAAKKLREQHGGRLPETVAGQLTAAALPGGKRKSLLTALEPKTYGLAGYAGVGARPDLHNRAAMQAGEFRRRMPELQFPELMKGLIQDINKGMAGGEITKGYGERTLKVAELAFGESYKTATSELASGMQELTRPTNENAAAMSKLIRPTENAGNSLTSLVNRLDRLQVGGPVIGEVWGRDGSGSTSSGGGTGPTPLVPSSNLNRGAQSTHSVSAPRLISSARAGGMHIGSMPITVNVPAGSTAADDPQALAELVAAELQRQAPSLVAMFDDRTDFRVENTLERG